MLLNEHVLQTLMNVLQIDDFKYFLIVKNSPVDESLSLRIPKMIKQYFSLLFAQSLVDK